MKIVELFLSFCLCFLSVGAQETALVKRGAVRYGIGVEGKMHYLLLGTGNVDTVEFRTDGYAGPALYRDGMNLPLLPDRKGLRYVGEQGGLRYALKYRTDGKGMELEVHCKNVSGKDLDSLQFSLRLGINTEMDAYPHWRKVFFPTLLRCEKTHFWGVFDESGRTAFGTYFPGCGSILASTL